MVWGPVVWNFRGTPKNSNPFHKGILAESKPLINHWLKKLGFQKKTPQLTENIRPQDTIQEHFSPNMFRGTIFC